MFSRVVNFSICLSVLFYLPYSLQRSTPESIDYVAAVVEYNPTYTAETDLSAYEDYINQAALQDADIIVFPEMTLRWSTPVPVPINGTLQNYPVPSEQPELYHEILVRLSLAARTNQIYIVVNIEEILNCTVSQNELCPEEEVYLFNTNVVFDRNGAVIDRYRKINLFGERTRTPSLDRALGRFESDFGVTFGHFICFDLQFQVPAIQLVQRENLTDVIFTTMWFSELPYLTAVQIQESYAYANNINFIAAGANNVHVGSTGTGIFSGKVGALEGFMAGTNTGRMFVSRVPKVPGEPVETVRGSTPNDPAELDQLVLIRDPSLSHHVSQLLEVTEDVQEIHLEDGDVKCHFSIKYRRQEGIERYNVFIERLYHHFGTSTDMGKKWRKKLHTIPLPSGYFNNYSYRATAFNGVRSYSGVASGGTRLCSIISCTDSEDLESCGTRFPSYINNAAAIFENLTITAEVPTPVREPITQSDDTFFFPITLNTQILPIPTEDFTFEAIDDATSRLTTYKMSLINQQEELLTFSVWGRVFEWDGMEPTVRNMARSIVLTPTLFAATIVLLFVYKIVS